MRRLAVTTLASLSLLATAGSAAGGGGGGGVPPFPKVPGNWTHVDINVTIKRTPHTISLDRGRITQVSPSQLTLRERDRSIVVVPLSDQTIVQVGNGKRQLSLADLRKGQNVMTMRVDGGPAVRVRILGA
jgi:hypothetical protein